MSDKSLSDAIKNIVQRRNVERARIFEQMESVQRIHGYSAALVTLAGADALRSMIQIRALLEASLPPVAVNLILEDFSDEILRLVSLGFICAKYRTSNEVTEQEANGIRDELEFTVNMAKSCATTMAANQQDLEDAFRRLKDASD